VTDRISHVSKREIERLRRNLELLEGGLPVSRDDPDKDARFKELLQEVENVSTNLERHGLIKARRKKCPRPSRRRAQQIQPNRDCGKDIGRFVECRAAAVHPQLYFAKEARGWSARVRTHSQ
jgi:hypothetical protein